MNSFIVLFALCITMLQYAEIIGQGTYVPGFVVDDKEGTCPLDNQIKCTEEKDECLTDCECPKQQKCCYQETCGNICLDPLDIVKPEMTCDADLQPESKWGTCPETKEPVCKEGCVDECTSDCECPGIQKCCISPGCGNKCRDPENPGTNPTDTRTVFETSELLRCARPCSSNSDCSDSPDWKCCQEEACGYICISPKNGSTCVSDDAPYGN